MSIGVYKLDDSRDTLLIARWSALMRVGWASTLSDQEVGWRLNRHLGQAGTLGSLRECCERWGIEAQSWAVPRSNLVVRVVEAVQRRQLAAYALPPVQNVSSLGADVPQARAAILLIKPERLLSKGAKPRIKSTLPPSAAAMSIEQRLADILDRTESQWAMRSDSRPLFDTNVFVKSVAVLALWTGTPLVTTLHIMAAMLEAAPTTEISRIANQTADFAEFVEGVKFARTKAAFDEAAKRLALLIEAIGPEAFAKIMRIVPEKVRGGGPVKEVYVYPPPRAVEHMVQERQRLEPPIPRSVLPTPPSAASPQAEALVAASESGVPFCEECAKRAAAA